MNLFDYNRERLIAKEQPLAARMRPRTLDEFVGQDHILAPGRLLRRAIQADQLSSLIFFGPPGTGKTTLASVIANTTESHFEVLNAVLSGVNDVRRVTQEAQRRRGEHGKRTILFLDEVHRWNKAQQDALLPWVENGTVILIGATTENPHFEVNRALVSRSRIFQLKPLTDADLRTIAEHALADDDRGYGTRDVVVDHAALEHMIGVANGDARALLNALELAAETTVPQENGRAVIDMTVAEESIQRRAVLYDKEGDYHFDTISAFIKSLRGSDPDAALYWLAKMVYAGEDPRFILRRLLIFAGEDVGLADPDALVAVVAAAEAFDRVGMPEGRYHLSLATLRLATAPKSNSTMGFFDALSTVEKEKEGEVPSHLRDASRDKEGFGHGAGYMYPHAYRDHWVAQQYLPDSLQGKVFYKPGELGYERDVAETVIRRREAQLAAAVDRDSGAPPEILTFSPSDRALDRWLARTLSGAGERLAEVRERVFQAAACQRHHLVLVLNADDGLLAWEALRRVPEGGVWCVARTPEGAGALIEHAGVLNGLRAPHVLAAGVCELGTALTDSGSGDVRFDVVVGRNVLTRLPDRPAALAEIAAVCHPDAVLCLAEVVPAGTQRLHRLVDCSVLDGDVAERVTAAEESIYEDAGDPMVNWDAPDLCAWTEPAGFADCRVELHQERNRLSLTEAHLERWFGEGGPGGRPSYAQRLQPWLSAEEIAAVRQLFAAQLQGQTVEWNSTVAFLSAKRVG